MQRALLLLIKRDLSDNVLAFFNVSLSPLGHFLVVFIGASSSFSGPSVYHQA